LSRGHHRRHLPAHLLFRRRERTDGDGGTERLPLCGIQAPACDPRTWPIGLSFANDIGIPLSQIYPYPNIIHPTFIVPDGGIGNPCVSDIDCPAGPELRLSYCRWVRDQGRVRREQLPEWRLSDASGMCGCDGQTILPVQSNNPHPIPSPSVYASAPSSGKIGPLHGHSRCRLYCRRPHARLLPHFHAGLRLQRRMVFFSDSFTLEPQATSP